MTEEDNRFISERLPALIAAEPKRAQKEKQEKIAKLSAGDPKDMSIKRHLECHASIFYFSP